MDEAMRKSEGQCHKFEMVSVTEIIAKKKHNNLSV